MMQILILAICAHPLEKVKSSGLVSKGRTALLHREAAINFSFRCEPIFKLAFSAETALLCSVIGTLGNHLPPILR